MKYINFLKHVKASDVRMICKGLSLKDLDVTKYSDHILSTAIEHSTSEVVELLLNDGRFNPVRNNNDALVFAERRGESGVFLAVLSNKDVIENITSEWVKENLEKETYRRLALNAISIYNF